MRREIYLVYNYIISELKLYEIMFVLINNLRKEVLQEKKRLGKKN